MLTFSFFKILLIYDFSLTSITDNHEYRLLKNLTDEYLPIIPNDNYTVDVNLSMAVRSINHMNQVDGNLEFNVWLRHNWHDQYLRWDPNDYGNITMITLDTDPESDRRIWVPDMFLINTAEKPMENLYFTKADIFYNGDVFWSRPGLVKATCVFNLHDFPYDTQICSFKFSSWVYHENIINLNKGSPDIDISSFQISDSWDLVDYQARKNNVKYACCENKYPDITFNFTLKRKSGYYDLNIVIPTFATATLMIFTLLIPWDSGERISYAVTVFLSIIVFLLILSENLPKTDTHSLLSKMLIGLTFFSLIIVFITIVLSALYSRKDKKLPKCVRRLFKDKCVDISEIAYKEKIDDTDHENLRRYESYTEAINNGEIEKYEKDSLDSQIIYKEEEHCSIYRLAYWLEKIFTAIFFIGFIIFSIIMINQIPE